MNLALGLVSLFPTSWEFGVRFSLPLPPPPVNLALGLVSSSPTSWEFGPRQYLFGVNSELNKLSQQPTDQCLLINANYPSFTQQLGPPIERSFSAAFIFAQHDARSRSPWAENSPVNRQRELSSNTNRTGSEGSEAKWNNARLDTDVDRH